MTEDEVASMSTDQSGSGFGKIGEFFTRSRKGRNDEQDLAGFRPGMSAEVEKMEAIGEEGESPTYRDIDETEFMGQGSPEGQDGDFEAEWAGAEQAAHYDVSGTLNMHDSDSPLAAQAAARAQPFGGPGGMVAAAAAGAAAAAAAAAPPQSRWRASPLSEAVAAPRAGPTSVGPPTPVPSQEKQLPPAGKAPKGLRALQATASAPPDVRTAPTMRGLRLGSPPPLGSDESQSLQDELLIAAALEFALHNSRFALTPRKGQARQMHAAARRIARTLVCLGRRDGVPFGSLALQQISSFVRRNRSDTEALAYWWSNACHLRGFLQSLNLAVAPSPGRRGSSRVQLHWASQALVPRLLEQEKVIFDELVSYMWTHTLVPRIAASRASRPLSASMNKRAAHEAAIRKWLDCLTAAAQQLSTLGTNFGHCATLRHQVLLELLKRMDMLLFHYLITVPSPEDRPSESPSSEVSPFTEAALAGAGAGSPGGPLAPLMDPLHPNMPVLDESMLFFTRGALSFGTGMTLKTAASRFQQWAFTDGGLKDIWSSLPEQGQLLFARLKGAAEVMMMPKELLLDEGILEEVAAATPMATVVYMLEHFQADDYAAERPGPDILDPLRRKAGLGPSSSGPAPPPDLEVEGPCTYYSPTDDIVMEKVETGDEPGLEYDGDSEDELEALGQLNAAEGMVAPLRFKLLHNLWSMGVPRTRMITIQREAASVM